MLFPQSTALQYVTALETPSPLLNKAFLYAKDNLARCMRWYSLGWGMSNAPHAWTLVVGRDTGWMCLGTDYVAEWFAPGALGAFRDRQKPNGQILEYIDMETGRGEDYGLNIGDNTPHYLWAVWHHWQQYGDEAFREAFLPSVRAAADHMIAEVGPRGLLVSVPAGFETQGITSWRNIIPGTVLAGEVTEINALSAMALRYAGEMTGEVRYTHAAGQIVEAINTQLWNDDYPLLNVFEGKPDPQITGDAVLSVVAGALSEEREKQVLARLAQPDFWTKRGLRTVPTTSPHYHPNAGAGLLGGSWPNLTLWYAAAVARHDPDRALAALEIVARPAVETEENANLNPTEFPEFFDGDTDLNLGMRLSPWVAPTLVWAVLEGLLGLTWKSGTPTFTPHWPTGWNEVKVSGLPAGRERVDITLRA